MIRDLKDFCFDLNGEMRGGACFVADDKGGAYISYYPKKKEYALNSYYNGGED